MFVSVWRCYALLLSFRWHVWAFAVPRQTILRTSEGEEERSFFLHFYFKYFDVNTWGQLKKWHKVKMKCWKIRRRSHTYTSTYIFPLRAKKKRKKWIIPQQPRRYNQRGLIAKHVLKNHWLCACSCQDKSFEYIFFLTPQMLLSALIK